MNGLLYTHQGWTDIINCLALINIYSEKYSRLYVLVREDAKWLILFYIRGLQNVIPIFCPKQILDYNHWRSLIDSSIQPLSFELIGYHDRQQVGEMKCAFERYRGPFERAFYEAYGHPYELRVTKFKLYRSLEDEARMYEKYVKTTPYVCVHSNRKLGIVPNVSTTLPIIELNESSEVFFDMIRILQHANEIHLIDSVWAAVCYHIDASDGLLSHVSIYLYCYRGHNRMFTEPKQLPNWKLVPMHSDS